MTADVAAARSITLDELLSLPEEQRIRREMALVADLVDLPYYATTVPDVLELELDPVEHFCRLGWRSLRKPNQDFDVWWYWMTHLDPAEETVNPLVHYVLVGRDQGLSTKPTTTQARPAHRLDPDRPVRRACLVAGFDADGVIDPSAVELITELSGYGDVFYLFDGYLPPSELAKLADVTAGAWAIRHAAYDFGSYSKLATELVGWERLEEYDEVVFANDSCFLVRPLAEVFATMDARECDWWGLQATKGMVDSPGRPESQIDRPVPIERVRSEMLDEFELDPVYTFHLGSYFLAFRRPVLDSPDFRRLIGSVVQQRGKRLVVLKYEVGLTHLLVGRGFAFDTYMDKLYPFHPMFSEWYFSMLEQGFPLLKRFLIYRNHYDVPGLSRWRERVLEVAPAARVDQFEQTLLRTAPADELERSLSITAGDDGSVEAPETVRGSNYRRLNRQTPKRPDWWVFAVDRRTHRLPDNSRAIFEAVKDDPDVTKIILSRSRRIGLEGTNVVEESVLAPAGRDRLLQAGTVFVAANPRQTLSAPVLSKYQTLVMVREGLQLEKRGRALRRPVRPEGASALDDPMLLIHPVPPSTVTGLLAASDVDQLAALAVHWPASYEHVWRTGIPAHDFLLGEEDALPTDLRAQLASVRQQLDGRRLLLFSPTQRTSGTDLAPYEFSAGQIEALTGWCERNDFVLGVRESVADLERAYSAQLGDRALDLSHRRYPSLHAVLRASDAMLTDHSGTALDFACTGRPVVSFVHDMELARDRVLYDLDHFFPGPVCRTFEELEASFDVFGGAPTVPRAARVRQMLVDHTDGQNTARVLSRLAAHSEGGQA
ncbi:rhamnan synthesis F family protein [Aeromicrobium wangtongii]|uniref:rhamnan synthesis F family protein n=1 Tax=Aeromicrobium wangtongii TaxID=2969247 RepID=UPI002017BF5C|nr:rhamnan synthesis F family protein [Aeromicrobium wangtongii]MCL3816992.1 CDP-glycerol glycerophosphotransferase family protein [Aeromicrobium wangtongii]